MTTSRQLSATIDWVTALKGERADLLTFCEELSPTEWSTPSNARGWSVQDVIAHIGSGCHAMFGPALVSLVTSNDIEGTNDTFVDDRRDWTADEVLGEYRAWSGRVVTLAKVLCRTPLRAVPVPLAELGRYPLRLLLCGALVFDHHTHLRYDIAPALDRRPPEVDENRMAVVLEWMMAVMQNQVKNADLEWLDRPVHITLSGPGGGTWVVGREGLLARDTSTVGARVTAPSIGFPEWATRRADWRDRDVRIDGDEAYGAAFLDYLNVV